MATQDAFEFSPREREVVRLVAEGKCRKAIAASLSISIHTVDTHLRHVHSKTRTHSLSELVVWSFDNLERRLHSGGSG